MKTRTKLIGGAIGFLILLVVANRFVRLPILGAHPAEAIPAHSSLVLSFNKTSLRHLDKKSPAGSLAGLFVPPSLRIELQNFEKLFKENLPIDSEKELLAVVQPTQSSGFDILFIIDGARFRNLSKTLWELEGGSAERSVFKGLEIFTVQVGNAQLAIAKYRNLLLFSRHAYLVENALSQLKHPGGSLCRDAGFSKIFKKVKNQPEQFHVLLNLDMVGAEFAPFIESNQLRTVARLGALGSWTHFQFSPKDGIREWKGEFAVNVKHPLMSANGKAYKLPINNVFKMTPDNLGLFFWMSVGKIKAAEHAQDWNKYFSPWVGDEAAFAVGEFTEGRRSEQFLLLKIEDSQKAESALAEYALKEGRLESFDYQMFQIQQLMGNGLNEMLDLGSSLASPYACVMGEYALFSNSRAGIERWLGKYIAGQTWSKDVPFLESLQLLPPQAHGFAYIEESRTWRGVSTFLTNDFLTRIGSHPLKFSRLAASFDRRGAHCEFTVAMPKKSEFLPGAITNTYWNTPLRSDVAVGPAIFTNPGTGEMEVFVQDKGNQIYLLSKNGRIIMQRALDEPVLSKIYQIDLLNNKEGQFSFNTPTGIYVIDRTGADMAGFPLRLQTHATNGLTVIDFFKSKDYQFFVACEDGNAYGFDEKGNPLEGWRPKTGVGRVRHPLVHFQSQGRDFMILVDTTGRMQAFQKNGAERFPAIEFGTDFPQAPDYQASSKNPRIVACNENGRVSVANTQGGNFGLFLQVGNNKDVKFLFADIIGDKRKDYIVLSGNDLAVHFYDGETFKVGLSYHFDYPQDQVFPIYWKNAEKAYLGVLSKQKKQISLLDNSGKLLPRFPLAGTAPFQIVDLSGNGKPTIVTALGNEVLAYVIE